MEDNNAKVPQKYEKYWNIVEDALNDSSGYGYKIAVMDTEKILRMALKEKNVPGNAYDDKVDFVSKTLNNPDKLRYSRAMNKKITDEIDFDISLDDTKEIIAGYYKAISDISEMNHYSVSTKDKIVLLGEKYSKKLPLIFRNVLIVLLVFFGMLFVSSETGIGREISSMLIDLSRLVFYKLIPTIIAIIAFIFTSLIIIAEIRKRKKH